MYVCENAESGGGGGGGHIYSLKFGACLSHIMVSDTYV